MEALFRPVQFRTVFSAPPQVDVLCASVSTNPRRTLLALSNSTIALISASGEQSLQWFSDPRLLIVALAQNADQIAILTLRGFCFVLDSHFFLASNWQERWTRFITSEFQSALELTPVVADDDFLDAFGLCSSARPGKASRPGKNSVNALCLELRAESVFSCVEWWGECLIAGGLLGDLYFIDSRSGAKECLVQIPTELQGIAVARDGGVFLLIESAMKVYYWLILQHAESGETQPFCIISTADASYFQPYALTKFAGKSLSIQQFAGADSLCVFSGRLLEVFVCSNLKCPAAQFELPAETIDFVCLFASYLVCVTSTERETGLTVFLRPHAGAQRKSSPDQRSRPDSKDSKLCLCASGCDTSKPISLFSYAKWLGFETSDAPAVEERLKLASRIAWKSPILVFNQWTVEVVKRPVDMYETLRSVVSASNYELLQQVILYSLHNAPAVFLDSLKRAIADTTESVQKFRLEILNVTDWTKMLGQKLSDPSLLPEVYNLASVLYRVKQDRSPVLVAIMLSVLCRLSPAAPLRLGTDLLNVPFLSPHRHEKPLIDLNEAEAEFFCDLCSGVDVGVRDKDGSVQDVLKKVIAERFDDLPPSLQLRLLLVCEQVRLPFLPVERLFLIAGQLRECALYRVISKALSYELLSSLHSPVLSAGEKYIKLLPVAFKREDLVSRTTAIHRTARRPVSRLQIKSLHWKAEKVCADFHFYTDVKPKSQDKVKKSVSRLMLLLLFAVKTHENGTVAGVFKAVYAGLREKFDEFTVKSAAVTLRAYSCLKLIAECEGDLVSGLKAELLLGRKTASAALTAYFRLAKQQKDQYALLKLTMTFLAAKGEDWRQLQSQLASLYPNSDYAQALSALESAQIPPFPL